MWDLDKSIEQLVNQIKPKDLGEFLNRIKSEKTTNLIESNLNLTANEVFEQRLGYSLAPEHFQMFYSSLKNKFKEE